jgi:hypothetical protein
MLTNSVFGKNEFLNAKLPKCRYCGLLPRRLPSDTGPIRWLLPILEKGHRCISLGGRTGSEGRSLRRTPLVPFMSMSGEVLFRRSVQPTLAISAWRLPASAQAGFLAFKLCFRRLFDRRAVVELKYADNPSQIAGLLLQRFRCSGRCLNQRCTLPGHLVHLADCLVDLLDSRCLC